jgi:hypothetical protein
VWAEKETLFMSEQIHHTLYVKTNISERNVRVLLYQRYDPKGFSKYYRNEFKSDEKLAEFVVDYMKDLPDYEMSDSFKINTKMRIGRYNHKTEAFKLNLSDDMSWKLRYENHVHLSIKGLSRIKDLEMEPSKAEPFIDTLSVHRGILGTLTFKPTKVGQTSLDAELLKVELRHDKESEPFATLYPSESTPSSSPKSKMKMVIEDLTLEPDWDEKRALQYLIYLRKHELLTENELYLKTRIAKDR